MTFYDIYTLTFPTQNLLFPLLVDCQKYHRFEWEKLGDSEVAFPTHSFGGYENERWRGSERSAAHGNITTNSCRASGTNSWRGPVIRTINTYNVIKQMKTMNYYENEI